MTKPLSKMHKRVSLTAQERALADHEASKQKAADLLAAGAEIPPNRFWDDANQAYLELNNSITSANEQLADVIQGTVNDPSARASIQDEQEVADLLMLVSKDIKSCREALDTVSVRHAGRSGAVDNQRDLVEIMEINALYNSAMSLYNGNVLPVVAQILGLLGGDPKKNEATLQQQALMADNSENLVMKVPAEGDADVITDVVVKEISTPAAQG